jgi:ABC-type multidrug transport system fused ATPase/permease subunit
LVSKQLGWALKYLKPYILGMIGIFAISFGNSYAFSLLPKVSANFFFELISPEKIQLIYKYLAFGIGIVVLRALLTFCVKYFTEVIATSAVKNIRDDLFSHIVTLDLSFFTKRKTGDIISLGISDVEEVKRNFYIGLINFFSSLAMVFVIMNRLFILNWLVTLASMGLTPILWIVVRIIGKRMQIYGKGWRESLGEVSANLHDSLSAIDIIKIFANEEHEKELFKKKTQENKRFFLKLSKINSFFGPLNETILYIFGMILLGIGAYFIIGGFWTAKELMEYIMLVGIMAAPLKSIPGFIAQFKIAVSSIDRILTILDTQPTILETPEAINRTIEGAVTFKDVWFAYNPNEYVLKGISFHANKGEVVALVGPSGAGKTTTANLLPRLYECESGQIFIDGVDVRQYRLGSLRRQIGVVSQNISLFNTTVLDNIRYARRNASEKEVKEAAEKAFAYDFIMEMPKGFHTNIGERGVKLSGGQKQRLTIARAILMNPHILILDEATSSLDSESEYYIQAALNELMQGRTSIIIAHRLSTVKHAHKILVMENGKIIDIGLHEELLERCSLYSKIYNLQYFR